ncbi:hypothetical protein [Nocardiopsis sp. NRRL B-16309]|uniref:hypothetical protein n=1 Tax=Nocardiopsis sp. NRRL B-16309 TaxID=1519494 RepID=UPI0006AFD42B|nr:hypothetical protein [Nocardiopsis sp. NRRL B-16309]KOX13678.1 hypothetical protein ADL05_18510 [Nocardiopsis sp. NRRL B-16309]
MAKKKTKSTSAKDTRKKRAQLAAVRRSHANAYDFPIDFGALRQGPIDVDTLAEHLPMPPAHTHHDLASGEQRVLAHSPARTWLEVEQAGVSEKSRDVVARWPFRIVGEGVKVPREHGWTCLRLLALQTKQTVEEVSQQLVELEDAALQHWHSRTNVYVLPADAPDTSQMSVEEGFAAIDAFTAQRAAEPAARRAARRWTRVSVEHLPEPSDLAGEGEQPGAH